MNHKLQNMALAFKTAKDLINLKGTLVKNENDSRIIVVPENDLQGKLIPVFERILGIAKVGTTDDFFKMGGNSIKAVQLIAAIQKTFNIQLTLVDIFYNTTIKNIAELMVLKEKGGNNVINPLPKQDYYDSSHAQKRMWILDHLDKDHIAYNMPDAFSIKGNLNIEALKKSYKKLIERHDSLRTTLHTVKGELKQRVNDFQESSINFVYIDLYKKEKLEGLINGLIINEVNEPFDLSDGPLIRTRLIKVNESEHVFLLTIHHIISDGWSMSVLMSELLKSYYFYCKGEEPALQELRIQYTDYVAWYNSLLSSSEIKIHKTYWMNKFSGKLPVLNLSDKPRSRVKSFQGQTDTFYFTEELTEKLKDLSNSLGVTIFMLLQGFVNILISKLSGEEDIAIGCPISGRIHKDLENQIGLYLNNIVLRNRLNDDHTFNMLLQQIKKTTLEGLNHQVYPYDKLVEDLKLKQEEGRNPLYDIMIVMETNDLALNVEDSISFANRNLQIESMKLPNPVSKLDLTFFFRVEDDIRVNVEFNTQLFNSAEIEEIMVAFEALINTYLNFPDSSIADLKSSLLDKDEKKKQLDLQASLVGEFHQDF